MRAHPLPCAVLALGVLAGAPMAVAADAPAGAAACSGCHPVSKAIDTPVPVLVGRATADIAAAMRDFRAGARAPTVMGRIARGFTDPEIEAIAAWFGVQRPP
jgi:sulfide dehydrogenase cytochrome subunit